MAFNQYGIIFCSIILLIEYKYTHHRLWFIFLFVSLLVILSHLILSRERTSITIDGFGYFMVRWLRIDIYMKERSFEVFSLLICVLVQKL